MDLVQFLACPFQCLDCPPHVTKMMCLSRCGVWKNFHPCKVGVIKQTHQTTPLLLTSANPPEGCFGQLKFDRWSARKKPSDKDRNLGRQCTPGLRVAELDGSTVAASEKWGKGRQIVAFRGPGVRDEIRKSWKHQESQNHSGIPTAGPSTDVSQKCRTLVATLRRKKWRSVKTVVRYKKRERLPLAYPSFSRACREMRRSARGGDPWARRARRCAAAVKGEVKVEVSDGQGQAARACEEKGFKAKTWVIEGLSGAQALLLPLHHLSRRARQSAVIIRWTSPCQRVVRLAVSRRFPEAQECGGNPRPDM